jgi:hypothetical protein
MLEAWGEVSIMKTLSIPVVLFVALAGCGDKTSPSSSTASQSRDSVDPSAITYRLIEAADLSDTEGSLISFRIPGTGRPPSFRPLRGTFEIVPVQTPPKGILFAAQITRLSFSSDLYAVGGSDGSITVTTADDKPVLMMTAPAMINTQSVSLQGTAYSDTFISEIPPILRGVVLRGEGFALAIFAVPEEP